MRLMHGKNRLAVTFVFFSLFMISMLSFKTALAADLLKGPSFCKQNTYGGAYRHTCEIYANASTWISATTDGGILIKDPAGNWVSGLNKRTYLKYTSHVATFELWRPEGGTRSVCFEDYYNRGARLCWTFVTIR